MKNSKKLLRGLGASFLPLAVLVVIASQPAHAQLIYPTKSIQTVADTPAATLLIPYFEVDLTDVKGRNTIFTLDHTGDYSTFMGGVNPQAPTAILAHVTIWSDLAVPVFNFNVYLTGYDVETVNLRNILSGVLPRTASAGQDPQDTISPKGPISQDINFASCNGQLPPANLTSSQIANLSYALSGQPAAPGQPNAGLCASLDHGDHIARGYVTVDIVNNCTTRNAGDPGYATDLTTQNGLTGSVFYVDPANHLARSINAVHIHADSTNPLTNMPADYTFYGRFSNFQATDYRQPLATTFLARFNPMAATSTGSGPPPPPPPPAQTSLIVWRDIKAPQQTFFACGFTPIWYPMAQEGIAVFDEQEHIQQINGINAFPIATQQVNIGSVPPGGLPVTFPSGWLFVDLNTAVNTQAAGQLDSAVAQGWVQVLEKFGFPQFVALHNAQQLDSATQPNHIVP